ncbi:MAG TPA: hypothetical protein P5137_18330, partial [Candidatus Brocadiia bacterium]|nr:hypothetical protein [Candidatus Brocadiia bacterium]
QTVRRGADCGDLALLKPIGAVTFADFERDYYATGAAAAVVAGTMAHRHDVDKLLAIAMKERGAATTRVAMAWPVRSFEDAIFRSEDGGGLVTALVAADDRVLGWAFVLNTGSPLEAMSKVLDYEVHPNYAGMADDLVAGTLRLAREQGLGQVYAFAPSSEEAKTAALRRCGFGEAARLGGYCGAGDLAILRHEP